MGKGKPQRFLKSPLVRNMGGLTSQNHTGILKPVNNGWVVKIVIGDLSVPTTNGGSTE